MLPQTRAYNIWACLLERGQYGVLRCFWESFESTSWIKFYKKEPLHGHIRTTSLKRKGKATTSIKENNSHWHDRVMQTASSPSDVRRRTHSNSPLRWGSSSFCGIIDLSDTNGEKGNLNLVEVDKPSSALPDNGVGDATDEPPWRIPIIDKIDAAYGIWHIRWSEKGAGRVCNGSLDPNVYGRDKCWNLIKETGFKLAQGGVVGIAIHVSVWGPCIGNWFIFVQTTDAT